MIFPSVKFAKNKKKLNGFVLNQRCSIAKKNYHTKGKRLTHKYGCSFCGKYT